jgi:beta-1,4-mannosyltransferase
VGRAGAVTRRPVRVLESFKEPGPQTNPYIIQLLESLRADPGVEPLCFSWSVAMLGRYDVFHAHWPESLIQQRGGAVSTLARRVLYALLLVRLRLLQVPIVRTAHNTELPQGLSRLERLLLRWTERATRLRIVLNDHTPVPDGGAAVLIEHGHYRDWFARYPVAAVRPGRVLFFGKVRRYKNVEGLVRAFVALPDDAGASSLRVVGQVSSPELESTIRSAAGGDPRVELDFTFVEDETLVREVGESALVVLPYPEMHNSGSVLAALSLGRPVLVPDNDFNRDLAREVGEEWVIRYDGDLGPERVAAAAAGSPALTSDGAPDLSGREWSDTGRRHALAFRRALGRQAS